MVLHELRADAITDNFKNDMPSINFIHEKDRKQIEERLEAAKWLWKLLLKRSLEDITDNLRGYPELLRYFDEYSNYENLLFALDDNHRDHVIHSVWVLLIGLYLRETFKSLDIDFGQPIQCIKHDKEVEEYIKGTKKIVEEHENAIWCLIALTHDLGYPIEKTTKANKIMSNMISYFGFLKQSDFSYSFTTVHQPAIESLLKILSSIVLYLNKEGHYLCYTSGLALDFAKSLERLDHGIISVYLLQMYLDFICELMTFTENLPADVWYRDRQFAAKQAMVITILRAVSAHTNVNNYWNDLKEASPFLLLCDELDEFSRYTHLTTGYEWVRMKCRTEFGYSRDRINIAYTLDDPKISDDLEKYFKVKVGKLHKHFELKPRGIKKIAITCKDIRKSKTITYYYEKSAPNHMAGIIKTRGRTYDDVQSFLNGTVAL
jgi:hypothetical protein